MDLGLALLICEVRVSGIPDVTDAGQASAPACDQVSSTSLSNF